MSSSEPGPLPPTGRFARSAGRPRIVIADPDPLARRTIRDALHQGGELIVVADAATDTDVVDLALHYRPELVLMEPALPTGGGLAATQRIVGSAPEVRVVLYSAVADPALELAGLRAGASGFLSKVVEMDAVSQALLGVVRGEAAISREAAMRLVRFVHLIPSAGHGMRPVQSTLTKREWEVLDLLSSGAGTAEIAAALFLSPDTIYGHVKRLMRKLGATDRVHAVELAGALVSRVENHPTAG